MFVPSLSWQNDPFCIKKGGGGVVLPGADRFERVLLELLQDGLLGLQRLLLLPQARPPRLEPCQGRTPDLILAF